MNLFAPANTICAPIGGFGNHVRWLVLLDSKYRFTITSKAASFIRYQYAKKLCDSESAVWPSYDDYLTQGLTTLPIELQNKAADKLSMVTLDFSTQEKKLESFKKHVYSQERTWQNWLWIEFQFRQSLDQYIIFSHQHNFNNINKGLILTVDPELALRCYLKLNSNLNSTPLDDFKRYIIFYNEIQSSIEQHHKNIKVLSSTILYQSQLDKSFYKELLDLFEIEDRYEEANYVHQLWYWAHLKAEKEFVQDITKFYIYPFKEENK